MGVFRGRGAKIDVMAISLEMREAVSAWFTVYVVVLDPGSNGKFIKDKNPAALIWQGYARVQPYRREVFTATPTQPTTNQSVRFQIDFSKDGAIPDIRSEFQVAVLPVSMTGNELPDPYLPVYQHIVLSTNNSSLAWVRTLETQSNTQVRVNWTTQFEGNTDDGFTWKP